MNTLLCDTLALADSWSVFSRIGVVPARKKLSEEDKRATTNVQNGLVFFFLFSFYSVLLSLN